jgi:hypothetical protein
VPCGTRRTFHARGAKHLARAAKNSWISRNHFQESAKQKHVMSRVRGRLVMMLGVLVMNAPASKSRIGSHRKTKRDTAD